MTAWEAAIKDSNKYEQLSLEKQSSIKSFWNDMRELELKAIEDYCCKREELLKQAILSCGYQYDEVIQYAEQRVRFHIQKLQLGSLLDGNLEYVLYDSYTQRAFILIAEVSAINNGNLTNQIVAYRNKQVPYNYHR